MFNQRQENSFPDVVEQPVLWGCLGDIHQADKYNALVNPDTKKVFSIISQSYRLIRHEEAADAETALRKLLEAAGEGDPFGLAILDMLMPGTDGEALGRIIKEEESIKGTLLVMMTSAGSRGDVPR